MPRRFALSIFLLLSLAPLALADYHYASHSGSNTYPYTSWETAADSVQKAINAATAGDTIYVGSGVWSDMPCTLWAELSFIGMGPDSTIIRRITNPPGYRFIWVWGNDVLVEGFTFDGIDEVYPVIAIEARLHVSGLMVRNNVFRNLTGALNLGENTGQILNNIFADNDHPVNANWGDCSLLVQNNTFTYNLWVFDDAAGNLILVNNIFAHNRALTVLSLNVRTLQDVYYIANNLIYRNQEGLGDEYMAPIITGGPSYYVNNIIVGPENYYWLGGVGNWGILPNPVISINNNVSSFYKAYYNYMRDSTTVRYGNTWDVNFDWQGYVPVNFEIGNIHANPMFASLDSENFHLQAFSPLIDAGDPEILDIDGTRSDIGAYGGPGGSVYSYLDIAPAIPESLSATVLGDSLIISWKQNYEADFWRYLVNRDTIAGFTPWAGSIVAEPETSLVIDLNWDRNHNYYYRIAAYDNQGNISPYSSELAVINVGIFGENLLIPAVSYLEQNYPNPFNSQTNINYHLADLGYQPAEVKLIICDIGGRLIRTIVDSRQYPGDYRAIWDGRNEGGESVSSGVYFARLIVSGLEICKAQKIMLLK